MSLITAIALSAHMHNIDPNILKAVLIVESNICENTINKKSTAAGCGQILKGTAKNYGLDYEKLKHDNHYNIYATGLILADLKKRFPNSWICRYHIGPGNMTRERHELCILYKSKLRRTYENVQI